MISLFAIWHFPEAGIATVNIEPLSKLEHSEAGHGLLATLCGAVTCLAPPQATAGSCLSCGCRHVAVITKGLSPIPCDRLYLLTRS